VCVLTIACCYQLIIILFLMQKLPKLSLSDLANDCNRAVCYSYLLNLLLISFPEFELVQNAFFTDPGDQSAWFYHNWLLGKGKSLHTRLVRKPNHHMCSSFMQLTLLSLSCVCWPFGGKTRWLSCSTKE
jgi:hypothetical protein